MSQRERWSAPAKYYAELCDSIRVFDRTVVFGAASTAEINRLETVLDRLRRQDAEKRRDDPNNRSIQTLAQLWLRYWNVYGEIQRVQEELKAYRPQLEILGMPEAIFRAPEKIADRQPDFKTMAERDAFNTEFSHRVADIELLLRDVKGARVDWESLTPQQQDRKLIMSLGAQLRDLRTGKAANSRTVRK